MGSSICVLDDSYVRPSARPPLYEDIESKIYLAKQLLEVDEASAKFRGDEVFVKTPSEYMTLVFSIKVTHSLFIIV